MENILIIGSGGQLGIELEDYLIGIYGADKIFSSDIKNINKDNSNFIFLDALNKNNLNGSKQTEQVVMEAATNKWKKDDRLFRSEFFS